MVENFVYRFEHKIDTQFQGLFLVISFRCVYVLVRKVFLDHFRLEIDDKLNFQLTSCFDIDFEKSMKNQDTSGDFNDHHEAQKRKWPYNETNSYINYGDKSIAAKKTMTSYNYDNFQINQQYIISSSPSTDQEQRNDTNDPAANCNPSTQMLNTMEISENIEYVNILYEDDLLTSIQAPVATESNYINFEPNWGNADILDLDQRNYYYDANSVNTVNITSLNEQLTHQTDQNSLHVQQQQQQHQHHPQIDPNDTQNLQITEHSANNHMHNTITEYEVIQSVYPEAENGREKSTSSLRKLANSLKLNNELCGCLRYESKLHEHNFEIHLWLTCVTSVHRYIWHCYRLQKYDTHAYRLTRPQLQKKKMCIVKLLIQAFRDFYKQTFSLSSRKTSRCDIPLLLG